MIRDSDVRHRPLVVRFGAMGDMVIVLTLIQALHRRFGAVVDVATSGAWARPLLEGQIGVGDVYTVRSRRTPYLLSPRQWQLVRALRARGTGPVWMCDHLPQALALLKRAGVRDDWMLQAGVDCPIQPGEHHLERWLRFAQLSPVALPPSSPQPSCDIAANDAAPVLSVLPPWRAELDALLLRKGLAGRPLVLIHAVNKRVMHWWRNPRRTTNTKYWPDERWATVITHILRENPSVSVLMTGVPAEAALNDDIARLVNSDRVHNVAREMSIPRLLALQERAIGMISVDTGPAHSAAALDCPLVVLFGSKGKPDRYAPRSHRATVSILTGQIDGKPDILGISPTAVIEAWSRTARRLD